MNKFSKPAMHYTKPQRLGLIIFVTGLILLELAGIKINHSNQVFVSIPIEYSSLETEKKDFSKKISISFESIDFNPNELDTEGWMSLGFSEKQANTIIKYKFSLGGQFTSKEQISECFVISEKKFSEIEPFIKINLQEKTTVGRTGFTIKQNQINYRKFNPNNYTQKDWEAIGFSERQSSSILKYKMSIGGSFASLNQIKSCYMISDQKFNEMKPYIVLEEFPKSPAESIPSQSTIRIIEEESLNSSPTIAAID